jgi:transposase-like protein
MNEAEAYAQFLLVRWPETNGTPVCPRCGCREHYNHKTRKLFQCKACKRQYSATSGTMFQSRKLSYFALMAALADVRENNRSSADMAADMGVQPRTAWYLKKRIRGYLIHGNAALAA